MDFIAMDENWIISLYHYFFLFLALVVAFLAVGAATKVWIFKNIDPKHQHALVATFLLGASGAVVGNYQSLPKLEVKRAEFYDFSIDYYSNFSALYYIYFFHDDYPHCFKALREVSKIDSDCLKIKNKIQKFQSEVSVRGLGDVYLSLNPKDKIYRGVALYRFPGELNPIEMQVEGSKIDEGNIELTFNQPERYSVKAGSDEKIVTEKMPQFSFSVNFETVKEFGVFMGVLYHPDLSVDCELLQAGENASLEEITNIPKKYLFPKIKRAPKNPLGEKPMCYIPVGRVTMAPVM